MKNKPCPFCGNEEIEILHQNLYVECRKCGCFGPSANINPFSSMQREIVESLIWNKWNKRYDEAKVENT